MVNWDSSQYLKFEKQRTQPALDLISRIKLQQPADIIDIGCGPGNSTKALRLRFPKSRIMGIDNSEDMIFRAKSLGLDIEFALCDVGKDLSNINRKFDIVFSNACIQWIPYHEDLLKNLMSLLRPGGIMAIQIPMNYDEPIHKIISSAVSSEKWRTIFAEPRVFYTLTPGRYYDLLTDLSENFTIWQTTYYHVMKEHRDIMEWYRGTGLRPYLNALSDDRKAEFEDEILNHIVNAYPRQANGDIIFRFPRLFFTAEKG